MLRMAHCSKLKLLISPMANTDLKGLVYCRIVGAHSIPPIHFIISSFLISDFSVSLFIGWLFLLFIFVSLFVYDVDKRSSHMDLKFPRSGNYNEMNRVAEGRKQNSILEVAM